MKYKCYLYKFCCDNYKHNRNGFMSDLFATENALILKIFRIFVSRFIFDPPHVSFITITIISEDSTATGSCIYSCSSYTLKVLFLQICTKMLQICTKMTFDLAVVTLISLQGYMILFYLFYISHISFYLLPSAPAGDYNLYHLCAYGGACVSVSRSFL